MMSGQSGEDHLDHRFAAAFLAISALRSGVSLSRRAAPPFLPSACAPLSLPESPVSSSASPVRILATRTAFDTTSAGGLLPFRFFGIKQGPRPILVVSRRLGVASP